MHHTHTHTNTHTQTQTHTHKHTHTNTLTQTHTHAHAQQWSQQQTVGTIFGISSAMLASVAFIFIRLIGKRETPITMVRFQ